MVKKVKKIKLDKYEKYLLDNISECSLAQNEEKLKSQLVQAARNHMKNKKSITIRVSPFDIEVIKIKASKLGIPYQTYINMLIHKDAVSV